MADEYSNYTPKDAVNEQDKGGDNPTRSKTSNTNRIANGSIPKFHKGPIPPIPKEFQNQESPTSDNSNSRFTQPNSEQSTTNDFNNQPPPKNIQWTVNIPETVAQKIQEEWAGQGNGQFMDQTFLSYLISNRRNLFGQGASTQQQTQSNNQGQGPQSSGQTNNRQGPRYDGSGHTQTNAGDYPPPGSWNLPRNFWIMVVVALCALVYYLYNKQDQTEPAKKKRAQASPVNSQPKKKKQNSKTAPIITKEAEDFAVGVFDRLKKEYASEVEADNLAPKETQKEEVVKNTLADDYTVVEKHSSTKAAAEELPKEEIAAIKKVELPAEEKPESEEALPENSAETIIIEEVQEAIVQEVEEEEVIGLSYSSMERVISFNNK